MKKHRGKNEERGKAEVGEEREGRKGKKKVKEYSRKINDPIKKWAKELTGSLQSIGTKLDTTEAT